MKEDKIRGQTKLLLDAYTDLTGFPCQVSIKDFIRLRREAVREISAEDYVRPSGSFKAGAQEVSGTDILREDSGHRNEPEQPTHIHTSTAENYPSEINNGQTSPIERPKPEEPKEVPRVVKKKTAYDILREIGDPWN